MGRRRHSPASLARIGRHMLRLRESNAEREPDKALSEEQIARLAKDRENAGLLNDLGVLVDLED